MSSTRSIPPVAPTDFVRAPGGANDVSPRPSTEGQPLALRRELPLRDELESQIRALSLPSDLRRAALFLVGMLDEYGYFATSLSACADAGGFSLPLLEQGLEIVQSCDPPGVGARTLRECLLLQCARLDIGEHPAVRVADRHLDDLAGRRYAKIQRALGLSKAELAEAIRVIGTLHPRPGGAFCGGDPPLYRIPDLVVTREGGTPAIALNREAAVSVSVDPAYRDLFRMGDAAVSAFLTPYAQRASFLQKSLRRREATMLSVGAAILEAQPLFFERGPGHLRPLRHADIASTLAIHESTVSRTVRDKTLACSFGTFPLSHFFSASEFSAGPEGDAHSSDEVAAHIRRLVDAEDKTRPLSDEKLTAFLNTAGIPVARRTVAKYRAKLGIPGSKARTELTP
ncbi:RNA polymerase factor sigma-54 [Oscillospiraceae bacterium OttesenSCG-928-G22]|nr:RNA polymerase factor sigma-54 [Oscillospiraceae bacterium OttesenSCG-928-G22]